MDIGVNLSEVSHEDIISLYNKVKDFVTFLETEYETSEVEKK